MSETTDKMIRCLLWLGAVAILVILVGTVVRIARAPVPNAEYHHGI